MNKKENVNTLRSQAQGVSMPRWYNQAGQPKNSSPISTLDTPMFIDEAHIQVISGKGGDGMVHFRREKYIPYGGPDGGDGGRGGDVILEVKATLNTLAAFQHRHNFKAKDGAKGGGKDQTGRSGQDLVIYVPPGTVVYEEESGAVLADLVTPGEQLVICKGGRGGGGNTRFAPSRNQAPRGAERGEPAQERLQARGYTLGHFPQSFEFSTLGGWIATRSCGQQSYYYGRIEDLFAGGHLEMPDTHLDISVFPASAAGLDLRELILGSEGRFGVLTRAPIRIRPLPETEAFFAVFFHDMESGLNAIKEIVQADLPISMVRLSDAIETETTLALAGNKI